MSNTMLTVRVDSADKQQFEQFCKETGMNVSVAINMFLKRVIRDQRLPFVIEADPFYSVDNVHELERRAAEVSSGTAILTEHPLVEA